MPTLFSRLAPLSADIDLWVPVGVRTLFSSHPASPPCIRQIRRPHLTVDALEFSDRLRAVLSDARGEAARLRHEHVGTEHLLLALLADSDREDGGRPSVVQVVLDVLSVDRRKMREVLEQTVLPGRATGVEDQLSYTSRAKGALELAMAEARLSRAGTVDVQHLLLGLLREERGIAAQVLLDFAVTADKVRGELARVA